MNQSLKLHLDYPIDMEIKRKLDDLENDIYSHIGRLQEIETKQEAITISLVSSTFLQFIVNLIQAKQEKLIETHSWSNELWTS